MVYEHATKHDAIAEGGGQDGHAGGLSGLARLFHEVFPAGLHPATVVRDVGAEAVLPDRLSRHHRFSGRHEGTPASVELGEVAALHHASESARPSLKKRAFERLLAVVFSIAKKCGLIDEQPEASIDATGLENHHVSRHFLARVKGRTKRYRRYPKVSVVTHHHSHLFASALARQGPCNDAPDFTPLVTQAVQNLGIDRLFGDAAYDAENHHRLAREELGIRSTVIPVNRRSSKITQTRPKGRYRRRMHARFPNRLYGRRWHVESAFSQHKRRLGSALRSQTHQSRSAECLLRVLTHNLMILWRDREEFYRAT